MSESLFTNQLPALPNASDGSDYTLGTVIIPAVNGQVTHGRWLFPGSLPSGPVDFVLYDAVSQALLARATFVAPSPGNWNTVPLPTPINVSAGQRLVVAIETPDRYVATNGFFLSSGLINGNLTAPVTTDDPIGNGRFNLVVAAYPNSTSSGSCYFVDLMFSPTVTQYEQWGLRL